MRTFKPSQFHIVFCVFVIAAAADIFIYSFKTNYLPISGDGKGYYLYLPAYVIHGDASYSMLIQALRNHPESEYAKIDDILKTHPATGRLINKYSIGVAVLLLPFFLAAHGTAHVLHLEPDGFSFLYQLAVSLGALFYLAIGIFFMQRLLWQRFQTHVVVAVLAITIFGSNLLYYATYEAAYSPIYSFFLFSLFVHTVSLWHETCRARYAILMGITLGLIILVRVPNILMVLFPLLYAMHSYDDIRMKRAQWRPYVLSLILVAAIAVGLTFPQLLIWKQGAGTWLINPYVDEHFDFTTPQIWSVLFGTKQGLFFYSPLLLLSLGGFFLRPFRQDQLFLPIIIFFAAQTFVIASWHCWWLGAAWGHRGFTESLSFLSIPMGYAIAVMWEKKSIWRRLRWLLLLAMAINILAMLWYWSSLGLPDRWYDSPVVRYLRNRL